MNPFIIPYVAIALMLFTTFCVMMRFSNDHRARARMFEDGEVHKVFLACFCWGAVLPCVFLIGIIGGVSWVCNLALRNVFDLLSGNKDK